MGNSWLIICFAEDYLFESGFEVCFWQTKRPMIMRRIPSHLAQGSCSPKKRSIQIAVKAGRTLLKALVRVTPITRTV